MILSDRRFGIEIEHGLPDGPMQAERILSNLGYAVSAWGENASDGTGWRAELGPWDVDSDGSGVEARTPILQGERGIEVISEVMTAFEREGGFVTYDDGMHVHHEALDYIADKAATIALMETWVDNDRLIDQLVSPFRRNGYYCCPKSFSKDDVEVFKENGRVVVYDRGALNMRNVLNAQARADDNEEYDPFDYYQPTIEIRLHQGTLDPETALNWVAFGQRLLDSVIARREPLMGCSSVPQLLWNLRVPTEVRTFWKQQVAVGVQDPGDYPEGEEYGSDRCDCGYC